ncbi:hypothetical protein BK011_07525 [Tenericutes bacterium MZ-XQ]|nr:hypothetical protein BK011_07525 [Tenericutes bacterium MZ-XQ]
MKFIKIFFLVTLLLVFQGCEQVSNPQLGMPKINGLSNVEYTIGDVIPNYLEGVTAEDYLGTPILDITVDDQEVNYNLEGTYNVYYKVEDTYGSKITASIKVFVSEPTQIIDYNPPYFEGIKSFNYYIGQEVIDYQAEIKAYDTLDGDITADIIFDGEVDFEQPGVYEITATVYDSSGNKRIERFSVFVYDNEAPVISGYNRIYHYIGSGAPDYMKLISAHDNEDGDITHVITINDEMVDLNTVGSYPLYYKVIDSYGHVIEQVVAVQVDYNDQSVDIDDLNVFYINDTHGSILENNEEMGLAKIGNVILDEYDKNPYETLFLSGGDLLQGNILSNFYYGASMIEMFNYMNLDVFVVGNHEFDWGLDTVVEYFDPSTLGTKAEYPLLAANLFYKDTETRPDFIDAYAIIEKGDLKIGVIGTIGAGLESSIAKSRVEDYEFQNPTYWTEYYTDVLIDEYQVDAVFAINHGNDNYYNMTVSTNGNINGIFNGHSHSNVTSDVNGVPLIQASSNARVLGFLSYSVDETNKLSLDHIDNLVANDDIRLQTPHPGLDALIQTYVNQIEPLLNEAILYSSQSYDRTILTEFMAEVMRKAADADVGVHNSGGTRDSLVQGQAITVATTYKIFPFDNQIISVYIKGSEVISLFNNSSLKYSLRSGLNENDIDPNSYYWVSTNDYVFGNYDEFQVYEDIYFPGIVDRIAFEDELRERAETTTEFVID